MLQNGVRTNTANVETLANSQQIRESIYELLEAMESSRSSGAQIDITEIRRKLHKQLNPMLVSHKYAGYNVIDKSRRIIAATTAELIGREAIPKWEPVLTRALNGQATIGPTFASQISLTDESCPIKMTRDRS